jgi:oxaloacetate decarboxylase alpha subunit
MEDIMGKVYITDTILRDAHQSQAATRMKTSEMLPAAKMLNKAGYWSLEMWGGATFDSCLRFLNEDPWERLRTLKAAMPDTRMQMLLRGQNLLGYKNYADDVVDLFVQKAIENGIDVIRIFDALNDTRNMERAMKATKKFNGHCEAAISYTTSPVHTRAYFVKLAKKLETMGADTFWNVYAHALACCSNIFKVNQILFPKEISAVHPLSAIASAFNSSGSFLFLFSR